MTDLDTFIYQSAVLDGLKAAKYELTHLQFDRIVLTSEERDDLKHAYCTINQVFISLLGRENDTLFRIQRKLKEAGVDE